MNQNCFTIDVEDWFNILDVDSAPDISQWSSLESRFHKPMDDILQLLDETNVKATFFWLGWFAERNPELVSRCLDAGHEIASHGYGHVLAYKVGRSIFSEDVRKSKLILEDITGVEVKGYRAAGFGTLDDTTWTFDEIKAAGFLYDSSVFPASRGHGGMSNSNLAPHLISTTSGELLEFPQSMIEILGKRFSVFGGGYLRLAPLPVIKRGIKALHEHERPLITYIHPRELDPEHPRLPIPLVRRFKSYVNLQSTYKKVEWICRNYDFQTMAELADTYLHGEVR